MFFLKSIPFHIYHIIRISILTSVVKFPGLKDNQKKQIFSLHLPPNFFLDLELLSQSRGTQRQNRRQWSRHLIEQDPAMNPRETRKYYQC